MFSRFWNVIKGILSQFVTGIEVNNPEAVYEQAINSLTVKYTKARNAVAGIVAERQRATNRAEKLRADLNQVNADLEASLTTDNDQLSATLLQKQQQLTTQLAEATAILEDSKKQAESAKNDLMALQGEIDKVKRERDQNIAKLHTARARAALQDQLNGLSTESEMAALNKVREEVDRSVARVTLNEEMAGTDIDRQLADMRKATGQNMALDQVKKLKAARQQQATGAGSDSSSKSM